MYTKTLDTYLLCPCFASTANEKLKKKGCHGEKAHNHIARINCPYDCTADILELMYKNMAFKEGYNDKYKQKRYMKENIVMRDLFAETLYC